MRYALISDIHANLPALEAVLNHITTRSHIDATLHLGDLVGYGPWPNETISLLRGFRIAGIQGNHDAKIAFSSRGAVSPGGREFDHVAWTAGETTDANKAFLSMLPARLDLRPRGGHVPGPTVTLVHGTPDRSDRYWFGDEPVGFFREMAELAGAKAGDVVCCAHTHLPWHRGIDGITFLNTGSVGRPKDGDWRAGYVVLDMNAAQPNVEFVRVEYDVESTVEEIRSRGLPEELAEVLRSGGRPETHGVS